MANRNYTEFSERKVVNDTPRPSPRLGSEGKVLNDTETKPPYNPDIGPGGPDLNRGAGFPKVKVHVLSKMSPELGSEMPSVLPSVQPMQQPGPTYVSNEGINASNQTQIADAARQGVFRKN